MRIIEPSRYSTSTFEKRRHRRFWPWLLLTVVSLGLFTNLVRPLPDPTASITIQLPKAEDPPLLAWPSGMQASVAADGYGVLATQGDQTPLATASIAKVIVAMCVLQKEPLDVGQAGPTYTINDHDVSVYNRYVSDNGSVMQIEKGEKLTEYQALVALMLPSANNVADSLASWVFGGHEQYKTYATQFLQSNGMTKTTIGDDASGFSETTSSNSSDLAKLGLLALKNPTLMNIAAKSNAPMPIVGTVHNYNTILGQNGITGLKTGNNDSDPGAFLFTASSKVGNTDLQLTGAVMGASNLPTALDASVALVGSLNSAFDNVTITTSGQELGVVKTAWGATAPIVSKKAVQLTRWRSTPVRETHDLTTVLKKGKIGELSVVAGSAHDASSLNLDQDVPGPSFWWRLTRH